MHIRDSILGAIEISPTELKIIETKYMQRLHYVKQLGFSYLVYPGANNTRFEHSLGAMHITKELSRNIFHENIEELNCAALLHDIGHGPFSHQFDFAFKKYLHTSHEEIGKQLIKSTEIRDIISDSSMSLSRVLNFMSGKSKGVVVSGSIGADRIDYLMRDSKYTGVAYGIIDYNRIKSKLAIFNRGIAVYEGGIVGAESMLMARYFMFSSVYLHHTTLIIDQMFTKALMHAIEEGLVDINEAKSFTDSMLFNLLLSMPNNGLIKRINERRLYKRAFYKEFDTAETDINEQRISDEVEKLGLGEDEYVISLSHFRPEDDKVYVLDRSGKKIGSLNEVSPLISTLQGTSKNRSKLIVACDPKNTRIVGERLNKILSFK
ncbi:MAG: HD domain-containing protein [Candidatus Marsarchaeota archaeon]|nr:HD domain-containing protein [Candidatus Marsarchaeota archaeon]MCL5105879.1 HD domain-containing protein [Candidatus Marsarchaeota archaeon]